MSSRPKADFIAILSQSGVPVTEEAMETKLKQEVSGAGSELSNDSEMSPFWRWVRAAVITPAIWLIRILLAGHVMPSMFVGTAERWALELKAWELNVDIKQAVKTQGNITMTKANADDVVTVSAGSIVQTLPIDGVVYQVQVLEETILEAGKATGQVRVEAIEAGAAYNLSAGYFNILPEEIPGIIAAENEPDWITRSGANEETDEELALRLQNAFTSSGNWHIDDAYRAIISSVAGVRSDNIYFENTGHITPATANAYIVMEVGPTPQAMLDTLNKHINDDGNHGHGDVLTCKVIPDSNQDVIADVVLIANLTEEQKSAAKSEVENRIRAAFRESEAFDEMTRAKPESRFSLSLMAGEIHNNMDTVKSVKLTVGGKVQEDIISGLEQPRLSSLTVREA
ncbi:baseplate J/gp47 family protein [Vibrio sp. HN007]|uniref:baseplate J/gp47 family protein n=1 Tax=Vibrio iocasae TaxID=3098914 RepID=UPI0035D4408E